MFGILFFTSRTWWWHCWAGCVGMCPDCLDNLNVVREELQLLPVKHGNIELAACRWCLTLPRHAGQSRGELWAQQSAQCQSHQSSKGLSFPSARSKEVPPPQMPPVILPGNRFSPSCCFLLPPLRPIFQSKPVLTVL